MFHCGFYWVSNKAVRFQGKHVQTKRLLAVILSANISFLTHFPHFSVLISLYLAESEGGWKPIVRPVKGMWGHNSRRPPLSASQPPHKAEIKLGPGTQTETSIFPDQLQIERKRRPKKWRNKLDVNIGVWDQEPGQLKFRVQSNWPLVVFLSLCMRTCVFCKVFCLLVRYIELLQGSFSETNIKCPSNS